MAFKITDKITENHPQKFSVSSLIKKSTVVKDPLENFPRCQGGLGSKCNVGMVKRQNRRTKSWFWGCSLYPKCKFTMNLNEKVVSKAQINQLLDDDEGPMPKIFEIHKWYIFNKPTAGTLASAKFGSIRWDPEMDKYDGKILKVSNFASNDSRIAWCDESHSFAYHIDWAEGPFTSKEDALRSRIKVVATRKPDIEKDIIEFENGLIEFYDRAVIEKIEANEVHLKDPESGIISVVQKSKLESKMNKYDGKYKEWLDSNLDVGTVELKEDKNGNIYSRVWTGTEWRVMSRSEGAPITCDGIGVVGNAGIKTNDLEVNVDAPSTEEFEKLKELVMTRFDELEAQKADLDKREAFSEKIDSSKKCKKDINKLFRDFHDRNKRRDELTKRLDTELSKTKKTSLRKWKNPAILTGCITAIAGSAYVLYPHVLAMF